MTVDVAIVSVARADGDARVERLVEALLAEELTVEVHALAPGVETDQRATRVLRPRRGPVVRLWRAFTLPFRLRAHVLVAVDPDLFVATRLAGRLRGRATVCDVFEDYTLVVDDRRWASNAVVRAAARAFARVANAAASGADLTLVADDQVPPDTARDRLVVRNLPRLDVATEPSGLDGFVAAYVGDVRVSRGALDMIRAVRAADGWELEIVGPVFDADADAIAEAIADDPRIRLHGRRPAAESWAIVERCSVGLSLLHDTPAYRGAMPTKIYEYANAAMAVITSPLPRPAAAVTAHGFGEAGASIEEIAATLDRWRAEPEELNECRRRAAAWAIETLGDTWPPAVAAGRIRTLADERSE